MPSLRTTYIILSGFILCAIVSLVVMAARYSEPGKGTIFTFTIPAAEVLGRAMTRKSEIHLHR